MSLASPIKKSLMRRHVTRDALDDPKTVKCSAQFYRISWSKPGVSVFKNGSDMANLIKSMFCDIT